MTTIKLQTAELRRALGNTILFASKDDTLPALCVVRFDVRPEAFTLVATNRYILSYERLLNVSELTGEHESFSMTVADVKELIRILPRTGVGLTTVSFDCDEQKITIDIEGDRTTTVKAADSNFVAWRSLVPDPLKPGERASIAFDAEWLGLLAKVDTGTKNRTAIFEFQDEPDGRRKAVHVQIGETFDAMVVPISGAG